MRIQTRLFSNCDFGGTSSFLRHKTLSSARYMSTTPTSPVLSPSSRWNRTDDGMGVRRDFKFKTFKKTWAFMNSVAEQCMVEKHHPEWSNVYNTVTITWTTHRPRGLTEKDLKMAEFCDEQAGIHGEVVG